MILTILWNCPGLNVWAPVRYPNVPSFPNLEGAKWEYFIDSSKLFEQCQLTPNVASNIFLQTRIWGLKLKTTVFRLIFQVWFYRTQKVFCKKKTNCWHYTLKGHNASSQTTSSISRDQGTNQIRCLYLQGNHSQEKLE